MNPIICLLVFLFSISDDILCVLYYRRVNVGNRKFQASILSGSITALVSFGVISYTANWMYVIPNIIGSMIGTPLAIWVDETWPDRKRARDRKGRFKVALPPPPSIPQGEKGF